MVNPSSSSANNKKRGLCLLSLGEKISKKVNGIVILVLTRLEEYRWWGHSRLVGADHYRGTHGAY